MMPTSELTENAEDDILFITLVIKIEILVQVHVHEVR